MKSIIYRIRIIALGLYFLTIFLCSCTYQQKVKYFNPDEGLQPTDSFYKEIPFAKYGAEKGLPRSYIKQKAAALKLDSIENGYDSLQIRVWCEHSMGKSHQIIIIKHNINWKAELITLQVKLKDSVNRFTLNPWKIISKEEKKIEPKSGWEYLMDSLFNLKIMTLPDAAKVSENIGGMDGVSIYVEVATAKQYRLYGYWSPDNYVNEFWQAKNMSLILGLIENEFDFKWLK